MRLFARTLLFFLGAITIQAVLTAGLIIGLVSRNNQNAARAELSEESTLIYENYNNWVRSIWKMSVRINQDSELMELSQDADDRAGEIRLVNRLTDSLDESGLDSFIVRKAGWADFIVLSDAYPYIRDFSKLIVDRPHPYVSLRKLEGQTFLSGTVTLQGGTTVFLLKNLDSDFFDQLKGRAHTRVLISSDMEASVFQGLESSDPYREVYDRELDKGHYNLSLRAIGPLVLSGTEYPVNLIVLISTEPYRSLLTRIGRIVFLVSLAVFALTAVTALLISRQITKPIEILVRAMRNIRDGDYDTSVEIDAAGEVKSLIGGFNEMADHLERNRATMDHYIQEITFLKEYNETVIHSLRAGILIVDRHLVVEKANGFFLESFPQDSGRPEGMNLENLRAAVLDEEIIQKARDISGGRKETWSKIKREGSVVWDLKLYPLRFAPSDGEGRCVIEMDDVSQRTELEQKIIQAEKLTSLGFLSAGIAHEINNPLSTILSNAQHLLSRPRDADDKVCLEWIEQETNRIAGIVKELLDFAHAAEGPSPESNVNACVTEVIRLVRYGLSPETDVDISLTVEPDLPSVKLPSDELRQILLNLIQNAIHAVDGRGSIEVETARIDVNFIVVRVADDGTGIAPELRPRIFDPFFTTKPDGVGTGLGLSIVYGFVKKAGGDISVTDNNGRGTVFSLKLPVGGNEE